jgi:hypothetical protein
MRKFIKIIFSGIPFFTPFIASAAEDSCAKFNALVETLGGAGLFENLPKICDMQAFVVWVIKQGLTYAGVVATLFIIYGGFLYVTAGGNEENSEKGKKILTNSIIGLIIIIMASTIVRVVATTIKP